MDNLELGKKITSLRKNKAMTQKELASMLHVSDKVISKWELGQSEPDIKTLKELTKIFNVSIGELIGENEEVVVKDVNLKTFEFFKRNYLLIIQNILCFFALLNFIIGYSILANNVPGYLVGIVLGFSVAITLFQFFMVFIKNDKKSILILKYILSVSIIAMMILSFIYLGLIQEGDFDNFYIVSGIGYSILIISSVLNILADLNILKSNLPFKIGKIIFILLLVLLGLQIGLVVGNITTISVAYSKQAYEEDSPKGIYFLNNELTFYETGESRNLFYYLAPYGCRQEEVEFYSSNQSVATVSQEGKVTAVGKGYAAIYVACGDLKDVCDVRVKGLSMSNPSSTLLYVGNTEVLSYNIYNYSELANYKNIDTRLNLKICDENDNEVDYCEILGYEIVDTQMNVSIKINDITKTSTVAYLKIYDSLQNNNLVLNSLLTIQSLSSIYFPSFSFVAGEVADLTCTTYPSQVNSQITYTVSDTSVAEIINNEKLYVKKEGTFVLTATAYNGKKATKTISVSGTIGIIVQTVESTYDGDSWKVGDICVKKVYFSPGKTPYNTEVKFYNGYTSRFVVIDQKEENGVYYFTLECKYAGDVEYYFYTYNEDLRVKTNTAMFTIYES